MFRRRNALRHWSPPIEVELRKFSSSDHSNSIEKVQTANAVLERSAELPCTYNNAPSQAHLCVVPRAHGI